MRQALDDLYAQLAQMQKQYMKQLEAHILNETSAFQKIQTKDLIELIALDMDGQKMLQTIDDLLSDSYLPETTYLSFLHDITIILQNLQDCNIPPKLSDAYQVMGEAIQSNRPLHMRNVFTCISITLLSVALCATSLTIPTQQVVIQKLDDLLVLKNEQLTLLKQAVQQKDHSAGNTSPFS